MAERHTRAGACPHDGETVVARDAATARLTLSRSRRVDRLARELSAVYSSTTAFTAPLPGRSAHRCAWPAARSLETSSTREP
eukprot:4879777-Prymnesium_polylepis.2